MRLKSFFAKSIEEAIRLARQELGPEAMLVNSKRTGVEAKHLGLYEVVVCAEAPEGAPAGALHREDTGQDRGKGRVGTSLPMDKLSQDVSELRQRMEKLALTLGRSGRGVPSAGFDVEVARAFTALTDAELDTELAYDIAENLSPPVDAGSLRAEVAKRVSVDPGLGCPAAPSRIVALVGPPGAGKTSALVKLATQYGLAQGKTVQFLTADTYRIAAADELGSYAAILGIGCRVIETAAEFEPALEEHQHKDLILVDTPGLCRTEMDASEELAEVLAKNNRVDTHLVLPASMRTADLLRASEQYGVFQPQKLLFTRIDETETYGPIVSLSARMGKPVSFLSGGQRIPEDLEPATSNRLLDLILRSFTAGQPKFGVVAA